MCRDFVNERWLYGDVSNRFNLSHTHLIPPRILVKTCEINRFWGDGTEFQEWQIELVGSGTNHAVFRTEFERD
jgi:hypothetical protein